ncbi:Ku protein [Streptomyces sp. NPDC086835]|uniref:Ku protein n=1 Tax=Streptomyces sp. NPDC086835 TaxID=3365761 RepID=UPI00380242DD
MSRIRYRKICELDGRQLCDDEIVKGYEISKDTLIPVTDQDLEGMPLPTAKAIDIIAFVPAESIDPVRIGDSYYLEADGQVSAKPYELLRQALERSGKAAPTGRASHPYRRGRRAAAGSLAVAPGLSVPPETLRYRSPSKSGLLLAPSPA